MARGVSVGNRTEVSRLLWLESHDRVAHDLISIVHVAEHFNHATGTDLRLNRSRLHAIERDNPIGCDVRSAPTSVRRCAACHWFPNRWHCPMDEPRTTGERLLRSSSTTMVTLLTVPMMLTGLPLNCWIIAPLMR